VRKSLVALLFVVVLGGATLAILLSVASKTDEKSPRAMQVNASAPVYLPDDYRPEPVRAKRPYKLGVLFPFLAAPFWVNEAYGILSQAKLDGVEIVWLSADSYDNIEMQNSQLESLVTLKVDAVLLAATSFNGTARAVDRAVAAGIPVLTHVTSSNSQKISGSVLPDNVAIGRKQARHMCDALGGNGIVAMLNGPAAADWSSDRVKGFKRELATDCPNVTIVAERFGIPDRADAQRLAGDILAAFPQINGVFTVADGMALGVADAARGISRARHLTITTASFSRETLPHVQNGDISVNVDESPVVTGQEIVNRAVQLLNGEQIPRNTFVPIPAWTQATIAKVSPDHWAPDGWRIK
jgi:ABC-type sugar transport system substrate-binding protein